jgi:catalase
MRYQHSGNAPVYAPNSHGGPKADPSFADTIWGVDGGEMVRHAYTKRSEDDDLGQAGTLVRQVMSDQDRANLASNIIGHATNAVTPEVQKRVVDYWTSVDSDLGAAVAKGIREAGGSSFEHAPTNGADVSGAPVGSGASTGL